MREISRNRELLKALVENNSLLDSKLKQFGLVEVDGRLRAEFTFEMRPGSSYRIILLRFEGVREISFYYNEKHIFYNVERVKFLVTKNQNFYIALDPADEAESISEEDQDFILANAVVGFVMEDAGG